MVHCFFAMDDGYQRFEYYNFNFIIFINTRIRCHLQQDYKEEEYFCIILTMPLLQFLKLFKTSQFLRLEIKIQPKEEEEENKNSSIMS